MNLKEIKIGELYEKHGIPLHDAKVFQKVAKEQRAVIMTRTPGPACGMLLEQGYDAKSFWVKSKSCSWGPMAGFVCLDPMLNKSLIKGALDNMAYATDSLTKVYEKQKKYRIEVQNGKEVKIEDGIEEKRSKAIPIRISYDRMLNLTAEQYYTKQGMMSSYEAVVENGYAEGYLFLFDNLRVLMKKVTIESSSDKFVFYDLYYDVKKYYGIDNNTTTNLYHNLRDSFNLKVREYIQKAFSEQDDIDKALKKLENNIKFWEKLEEDKYLEPVSELQTFAKGEFKDFRPLRAMTNAHRPYKEDKNSNEWHLNALTGDYDLFAIWPYTISIEKKDENGNVVLDEKGRVVFEYEYDENLDVRVAGMTQNLADNELITKEGGDDIGKVVGNITDRIYLIGQLINSLLPYEIKDKEPLPYLPLKNYIGEGSRLKANRVYHSDEAGRPFVKSVDSAVGFGPDGEVFEITAKKAVDDLSNAIVYFHHKGYKCFVNKGWKGHLTEIVQAYVEDNKSLEKPNKFKI